MISLATPERPDIWLLAAATWSARRGHGPTGASGDPAPDDGSNVVTVDFGRKK